MLDRNADSSESEEQLPQGPWDGDKWDSHVLLSVIGPNAKGKNKSKAKQAGTRVFFKAFFRPSSAALMILEQTMLNSACIESG